MRNGSKGFMIMVGVMLAFSSYAQKPVNDTIDLVPGIEVSVMLKDDLKTIKLPAYCGLCATHMVLTYNVIKTISGTYGAKTIRIDILCPRESVESKNLTNGKVYRYKLKPSTVQTGINQSSGQLIYEIAGEKAN